jgi:predicted DNA-binding ribbon-helix-helix protein
VVRVTVDLDAETVFRLKRIAQAKNMSLYMLVKEVLKELAWSTPLPPVSTQGAERREEDVSSILSTRLRQVKSGER